MSYSVVVPFGGYAGWAFLERTMDSQKDAFTESSSMKRDTDYFRENIGSVSSVEDLMADRRLLTVALGAFGLDDDINNTYFIQKVLSDGTDDAGALANKLSDKSYLNLSQAFGFGGTEGDSVTSDTFADDIITRYQDEQFEMSLGEASDDMRLALNVKTELASLAATDTTENGLWYSILGSESVRAVFETALGLPEAIGAIDIDQQVSEFREKSKRYFGDGEVAQFSNPEKREELIRLFLARSEISELGSGSSSAQNALTLLSGR